MSKFDHTNVEVGDTFESKSTKGYYYEVLFVNEDGALLKHGYEVFYKFYDFKSMNKFLEKVIPKNIAYLIFYEYDGKRTFDREVYKSREEAEDTIDDYDYENAIIIPVEDTYNE